MNEPNHLRRIVIAWLVLSAIATPIVVAVIAPTLPPGNGTSASSGQVFDNTVLLRHRHPDRGDDRRLLRLHADRLPPPRGRRAAGGRRDPTTTAGVHIRVAGGDDDDRPLPRRLRHGRAGRRRVGRRPGTEPGLQALGRRDAGAGDRPAVGVHLPLPDLRRDRDRPPGAAGRPAGRAPRHLARRDPLLLGAEAGGQGRRQPRRRQRRLREARTKNCSLRTPLQRALRPLARLHVRHRRRWSATAAFERWIHDQQRVFAPATKVLPPYATHYFPEPERRAG